MVGEIYGKTGDIEADGRLTAEQQTYLNEWQMNTAATCIDYLNNPSNKLSPLVAAATGIGKGKIIHHIIEEQLRLKPDSKVLVIAGTRVVLVDQTQQALNEYQQTPFEISQFIPNYQIDDVISENQEEQADVETTIEELEEENTQKNYVIRDYKVIRKNAKKNKADDTNVHVATIQTIQTDVNKNNVDPTLYDLVIVDEVHNIGTLKRASALTQFKRKVGFTATPFRHSGSFLTPEEYGFDIAESFTLPEAQEKKLLPPLVNKQINTAHLVESIPMNSQGKINYAKLEKLLKTSPQLRPFIAEQLASLIKTEQGTTYKTMVAVNFVWEAQEIAELLKKFGVRVGIAINKQKGKEIHTEDIPAINALERYELPEEDEQSIDVLISPYVAGEGFDAPYTEILVWASPTDSPLRYTQYTGRLARRAPGKAYGIVVDFMYQTTQFNWSYNFGMWMKDEIKELPNGMQYIGSADDAKKLASKTTKLSQTSDNYTIKVEEKKDEIMPLQSDDIRLSRKFLRRYFVGVNNEDESVKARVHSVIKSIIDTGDSIVLRRFRKGIFPVARDFEVVKAAFIAAGFTERVHDAGDLLEGEVLLNISTLERHFVGDWFNTRRNEAKFLIDTLRKTRQDLLFIRRPSRKQSEAIVLEDLVDFMKQYGIERRQDILPMQPNDIPLSVKALQSMYIGDFFAGKARTILDQIVEMYPHLVLRRDGYPRVFIDKELFMQLLAEKGIKHRQQDEEIQILDIVQETDIQLNASSLQYLFIIESPTDMVKAMTLMHQFILENKKYLTRRKTNAYALYVIEDYQDEIWLAFLETMEHARFRYRHDLPK